MIKMYGPVLVIGFGLVGKIDVGWSLDGLVLCFCCFERDVDFRLLLRRLMPRLRPVSQRLMAFNLILKSNVSPSPPSPLLPIINSLPHFLLPPFHSSPVLTLHSSQPLPHI